MTQMHTTLRRSVASLAAVAAGLAATACVDLTETPISGITASYYSTPQGFDAAVNASYEELRNWYGQEMGMTMTVFGTDEFTKGADGGHKHFNDYTTALNGDATYTRDMWRNFYRAINTANTVITRGPTVKTGSAYPEARRDIRVAEAKYLRAFYFFTLVRTFGDIPLPVEETAGPMTEATREPVAKVYDQIIKDLKEAEAALPATQSDYGRATKHAAQNLLGLVYLTRGAASDFALAEAEFKKVIASGLFSLTPRYSDLWRFGNERNSEIIWSVQYTPDPLTTGPGNKSHLYFIMAYELLPGMQRDLANGRAFKRFRSTNYLLNLWDRTKDTRYEDSYTVAYLSNNAASIPKVNGVAKWNLGDTAVFLPGYEMTAAEKAARPYNVYNPSQYTDALFPSFNKKFIDPNRLTVNDERGSRDFYVFRLADTYLLLAEALVRGGKASEAVQYVNLVRRRAAKPGVAPASMDVTVAEMNIDFILDERSRELAGEQMRIYDLLRTGKLQERLTKYNSAAAAGFKAHHVLRPIPNEQITLTSNTFPQNPGY